IAHVDGLLKMKPIAVSIRRRQSASVTACARATGRLAEAQVRVRARASGRVHPCSARRARRREASTVAETEDRRAVHTAACAAGAGLESHPRLLISMGGPYGAYSEPRPESIRQSRVKMPL